MVSVSFYVYYFLSDREGHGHKAVLYKSHFPPLRRSVVRETPLYTLANKPRLHTKDKDPLLFIAPRHFRFLFNLSLQNPKNNSSTY